MTLEANMYLRPWVLGPAVLALLALAPSGSSQTPALADASAYAAIELPAITGEIDPPAVITIGHAEIRPQPGARVLVMSALGRVCGVVIDGQASFRYRVRDPFSQTLAKRTAGRAGGLTLRAEGGEMWLFGTLRGAAVWGWDGEWASIPSRPASGALPAPLQEILDSKRETNPGRDMLLSLANGDPGFRWAVLYGDGDPLMLDVDPGASVRLESLSRLRRVARGSPYRGALTSEQVVAQPIDRPWWLDTPASFVAVESDLDVRNPSGTTVTVTTRTRIESRRDGLRALPLSLMSARMTTNGELRPYTVTRLTIDGAEAPYVHTRDALLVMLPRALRTQESVVLEVTAGGDVLERPDGDNYWRLGDQAWYPRPFGGGERATFRVSVETAAPYVPFAPGELVERRDTAGTRRVVTRLPGPMDRIHVIAGKYSTFSDERDGMRVHVSTYASARKEDALRVAGIVHGVRACLTDWLGAPYPFQDLQVLEITDWGWGQAPPGLIFVTREAFLNPARAAALDAESRFIASIVSRGVNERVAHEVAHAWFPHIGKVERAEENWLSESLADYTSAVCVQRMDTRNGKARFDRQLADWKYAARQISPNASIYLAAHLGSAENDARDWQALLYAKGPLVLHAIREELARTAGGRAEGDRLFFTWLRSYIRNFTFKTGETRHLIGILNQMTKRDWHPWFERYVYGTEAVPLD
jgi:hypothetical protein